MSYEFVLSAVVPTTPLVLYDAWLDSAVHTAMTGGQADVDPSVGGGFTAWNGYIAGTTLELLRPTRIVQSWRTEEFLTGEPDSMIEVIFKPIEGGTLLTLHHSVVPLRLKGFEEGGWRENYFDPMVEYFAFSR